jgi:hypothetical protein
MTTLRDFESLSAQQCRKVINDSLSSIRKRAMELPGSSKTPLYNAIETMHSEIDDLPATDVLTFQVWRATEGLASRLALLPADLWDRESCEAKARAWKSELLSIQSYLDSLKQ